VGRDCGASNGGNALRAGRPIVGRYRAHEIEALFSVSPKTRTAQVALPYMQVKLATGLRRGDILRLRLSDLRDDGIHVTPHKTEVTSGVKLIFPWVDQDGVEFVELKQAVDAVLAIPPKRRGEDPFVFTTREGQGFYDEETGRANGFDTLWRRFVDRALAETSLTHSPDQGERSARSSGRRKRFR